MWLAYLSVLLLKSCWKSWTESVAFAITWKSPTGEMKNRSTKNWNKLSIKIITFRQRGIIWNAEKALISPNLLAYSLPLSFTLGSQLYFLCMFWSVGFFHSTSFPLAPCSFFLPFASLSLMPSFLRTLLGEMSSAKARHWLALTCISYRGTVLPAASFLLSVHLTKMPVC